MYKLLIVDDNFYDRKGLAELPDWEELNFSEIHLANNGEEGLAKALEIEPLLVLTDISMPHIDGLTMAKKILEKKPKTKFIFVSCFDDSNLIRESIGLNAFGYILKPIDVKELIGVVKKVLENSDLEKSRFEEVNNLQIQLQEQRPYVQGQIIRDLIRGKFINTEHSLLERFNMMVINYYAIVVVRLNIVNETNGILDKAKISFEADRFIRLLNENVVGNIRICAIIQNNGDIVTLLYIDENCDMGEAENKCFAYFDSVKEGIRREENIDILVCIGGISNDLKDIHELYNRAELALSTNLYRKSGMIVLADDINTSNVFLDCDFEELKNELRNIIESRDMIKCGILLHKYYGNVEAVNKTVVKEFTLTLISTIQLLLFEMNLNLSDIFDDGGFIWEKLSNFNSIIDIKQWIYNILRGIIEYCSEGEGDRDTILANRIKKIIEEQYLNLDNVNQISEQIYVSSVHANKVFKKCMGCTMFDYLTKIKIEKAKELLEDSNYKIYEIVEMLGYKSKTYFTSLFKEYTGKTPKEYRMVKEKH